MLLAAIQVDATEGGRVLEVLVAEGDYVHKGQAIFKLSNTELQTHLANQETAAFDVLSKMQNIRNNSDQNSMRQLNHLAEVENALAEAERVYNLNKYLFAEKAIGSQELRSYENSYKYQLRRLNLTREALNKDSATIKRQLRQMEHTYTRMQNELAQLRQKAGNMIVRSPVDGQFTSLNAKVGQIKSKDEKLGQVNIVSGYKIRVDLNSANKPEVFEAIEGSCTVDGITYRMVVHKVNPGIVNDQFHIDMVFQGKAPAGLKIGAKLPVQLAISERTQALVLPWAEHVRPLKGKWPSDLNNCKSTAYDTTREPRRQTPRYISVTDELHPADKIVNLSYGKYEDDQELVDDGIKFA